MKKIISFLLLPVILLFFIVVEDLSKEQGMFCADALESLTSTELKPGFIMGFVSAEVWYNSAISGSIAISMDPEVAIEKGYTSMICCVNANLAVGCNFNIEADECKRRVVRNPH